MFLRQVFDPHLAQFAYVVGCQRTGEAIVIDPLRDVDQYQKVAEENDLRLASVAETHIHADFVSGAAELAAMAEVRVLVSAEGGSEWQSEWANGRPNVVRLHHGETFRVGGLEFRVVHTPGHTPEHLTYLVTDRGGGADEPMAAFTGDFLFVGDVGRPDLLESAAGVAGAMEPSARRLYHSLREFAVLPDWLQILPGHGAGSACGKSLGAVPVSTLGYEKRFNPALNLALTRSEDAFVSAILDAQPEPPAYFATMKRVNKAGPPILGALPCPARLTLSEVVTQAAVPDVMILDTRGDRTAWLAAHVRGSLHTPPEKFSDFAGSWVNPAEGVILLVEKMDQVEGFVRQLLRMGFDLIRGVATVDDLAPGQEGVASSRGIHFDELESILDGPEPPTVLDVRRSSEYDAGHVRGAQNIAHTRLRVRLSEIPSPGPLVVHCGSGVRAVGACSLLERSGRDVLCINDSWAHSPVSLRST